jgi:hypothetical protein
MQQKARRVAFDDPARGAFCFAHGAKSQVVGASRPAGEAKSPEPAPRRLAHEHSRGPAAFRGRGLRRHGATFGLAAPQVKRSAHTAGGGETSFQVHLSRTLLR